MGGHPEFLHLATALLYSKSKARRAHECYHSRDLLSEFVDGKEPVSSSKRNKCFVRSRPAVRGPEYTA
jgi:hypothetical protein